MWADSFNVITVCFQYVHVFVVRGFILVILAAIVDAIDTFTHIIQG